jgi:hypothetical protein
MHDVIGMAQVLNYPRPEVFSDQIINELLFSLCEFETENHKQTY